MRDFFLDLRALRIVEENQTRGHALDR